MRTYAPLLLVLVGCAPEAAVDTAAGTVPDPIGDTSTPDDLPPDPTSTPTDPGALDRDGDGLSPRDGDCDDADPEVHPDALEVCDAVDNNCNGLVDEGLDDALLQTTDYGADGVPDLLTRTSYDAAGRLVLREIDTDADGVWEVVEAYAYVYDAHGRLLAVETDAGDDGTVDSVKRYVYDGGALVAVEQDDDVDGTLDRVDTYAYDDQGRRVRWELDSDADGNVDTSYDYTYDPATGLQTAMHLQRFDDAGALTGSSNYHYAYTDFGRVAQVDIDLDGDGVFDNRTIYGYDAAQNLVRTSTDVGIDGTWDSETSYVYDGGMIVEIEIDGDGDGAPDTRVLREDTCAP